MTNFREQFAPYLKKISDTLKDKNDNWTVKGFVDLYENIYTISDDTKVVLKIIELMIFPLIMRFVKENKYKVVLAAHQNHYPDLTFIDKNRKKIAVDVKTTYRRSNCSVNGFTLGSYTGYFRNTKLNKNITFPYSEYESHLILGFIYTRDRDFEYMIRTFKNTNRQNFKEKIKETIGLVIKELSNQNSDAIEKQVEQFNIKKDSNWSTLTNRLKYFKKDNHFKEINISSGYINLINYYINMHREKQVYKLENLDEITSVIKNVRVFLQDKWKLAKDKPGSENTKNIGSIKNIEDIIKGKGPFTRYEEGKQLFYDYWRYYMTNEMARRAELNKPPYNNLDSFLNYKNIKPEKIR